MKFAPIYPLTVYYDASCPLCASEMHALKQADTNGSLILADCSDAEFDDRPFACHGITRDSMLRLIHARDADGRWLIGVDVFEAAYGAVGFATLARLWGNRTLRPMLEKAYPWVARNRYTLSRFGLPKLFGLLTEETTRRTAATSARGCSEGVCMRNQKPKS